jgi:hypothetical protein
MFTALIAPKLFSQIFEYPLLLALSMACRPGALTLVGDKDKRKDEFIILWLIAAAGILAIMWLPTLAVNYRFATGEWGTTILVVGLLSAILIGSVQEPPRQLVAALLIAVALIWLPSGANRGESQRSFFGVYRVHPSPDGVYKTLIHGTTLHGAQRFLDDDGNPVDDTVPTTYYYPGSPIGQTIAKRRQILTAKARRAATASSVSAPAPAPATSRKARPGVSSRSIPPSSRSPRTRRTLPSSPSASPTSTSSSATPARPWPRRKTRASICSSSTPSRRMRSPCTC